MSRAREMARQVRRAQAMRAPSEPADEEDRLNEQEVLAYLLQKRVEQAEQEGNTAAADKWRRYLDQGREQVIADFLALDEMSIPHAESGLVQQVQEGPVIYSLSRIMFCHDRATIQMSRGRLYIDDLDMVLRWLAAFGG
jgi:hypothetical protein